MSPRARLRFLFLLPIFAGCWTSAQHGDVIDERLRALEADDKDHGQALDAQQKRLAEQLPRIDAKLKEMTDTLEKVNRAAHRTGADVETRLDDMQEKMQELSGQLAEARHRLEGLQTAEQAALTETDMKLAAALGPQAMAELNAKEKAQKLAPAGRDDLFAVAFKQYKEGDPDVGRELFLEFLRRYPQDAQAGDAQYYIGDSYYQTGRLKQAALAFGKLQEAFPKSDRVCDARLKLGLSFSGLKMPDDARTAFEETLHRCGGKVAIAKIARQKLAELVHAPAHKPRRPAH
ncbi:MAG: tetratricopeptide repeat protein [Deltaproteobacteria bacterium]